MATHNTLFSHLMASCYHLLWDTQKISRARIFKRKDNPKRIVEQHRRIVQGIKDRDAERAGREAGRHIDFVERELRMIMAEDQFG
jgi:DNA-binding FadR family transcriptional regulator